MHNFDEIQTQLMKRALDCARTVTQLGEVPVGALIVYKGDVIAESGNTKEATTCATGHAEINVIQKACEILGTWRLNDCDLFVTLEPCLMCAGAIIQARLGRVFIGAMDPKTGAVESLYKVLSDPRLNHRPEVYTGLMADESSALLKSFFKIRREQKSQL